MLTLCFDDCYKDTLKYTLPLLKKYRFKATYAVIAGLIGKKFEGLELASVEDLKNASNMGMDIASHSLTHADLSSGRRTIKYLRSLPYIQNKLKYISKGIRSLTQQKKIDEAFIKASLENEIIKSKQILNKYGFDVSSYIYPGGYYNQKIKDLVQKYYLSGRSTDAGINKLNSLDYFALKVFVWNKWTKVKDANKALNNAIKNNAWFIEIFHLVSNENKTNYEYFTKVRDFKDHLDYIKSKSVFITSQNEIIKYIREKRNGVTEKLIKQRKLLINELSVIIPTFNGQKTLEKCLKGILNQKYYPKKFEIVVVNDGSTDKTQEIAEKFPVRLINLKKNQGRITARNIGANGAKYKYFLFLDADCIPDETWIYETLKHNYEPVQGQIFHNRDKIIDRFFYLMRKRFYRNREKATFITEQNFFRFPKGIGNFLVSKELYKKVYFRNTGELFSDDQYFIYEIIKYKKVLSIPKFILHIDERSTFKEIFHQWFQRGTRFADFYLKKGGILEREFYVFIFVSIIILLVFIFTSLEIEHLLAFYLFTIVFAFVIFILYFSEKKRDILIISLYIFPVVLAFILGISYRKLICKK